MSYLRAFTVRIPSGDYRLLKTFAAATGETMGTVVTEALRLYMSDDEVRERFRDMLDDFDS